MRRLTTAVLLIGDRIRHTILARTAVAGFVAALLTIVLGAVALPLQAASAQTSPLASAAVATAPHTTLANEVPTELAPAATFGPVSMGTVPLPPSGNITVTACEGTTSTAGGVINTPGSFTLTGTAATDLRAGKTVFLYENRGITVTNTNGTYNNVGGGVPYCGAKYDPATGLVTSTWRFCTDETLYGCSNRPPSEVATNPRLDADEAAQIAYILIDADLSTKRSRAITQIQVWCISEDRTPGTVFTPARNYFNTNQFNGTGIEGADLTNAEATCAPLPVVPTTPTLTVVGPTVDVNIGSTAQFVVTPNFTADVVISVVGGSSPTLCPAMQTGVTLAGDTLTFTAVRSATVCVTATDPGTLTLTAVAADLPSPNELTYIWSNDPTCQVFVDYTVGARVTVEASDTANVKAVSIGDYVWWDVDRDGAQDIGEAPVPGVTVNLVDATGSVVATTTTDPTGYYHFSDLPPSTPYTVVFVKPADASFTTQNAGTSDASDSDANVASGEAPVITPSTGTNLTGPDLTDNPTIDAGLVKFNLTLTKTLVTLPPFVPGATVVFSLVPHNDGLVAALAGWSVTDILPAGLTLVSMSSGDPTYTCTGTTCTSGVPLAALADGAAVTVTATIDAGFTGTAHNVAYISPSPQDVPETNVLIIPTTSTDTSTTPTDNDAQADLTVDLVSIGDYVWWDTDHDGQQDAGEPAVPGVTVNLLDASGDVIATTTTDATGYYYFSDLVPATQYTVQFVKPEGAVFTVPNSGADTSNSTDGDLTDSDADVVTGEVTITSPSSGANQTGPGLADNPGIDAGFVPTIPLQIEKIGESDAGWVRMDGSSFAILQDVDGEPGMSIAFTFIDVETGLFQIDDIEVGTYWLSELTAPDGFSLLAQPVQFTINPDRTVTITGNGGGAVTANGQLITVRDVPALVMPATGGAGPVLFFVGGSALILLSIGLILYARRRRGSGGAP